MKVDLFKLNEWGFRNRGAHWSMRQTIVAFAALLLAGLSGCSDKDMPDNGTDSDGDTKEMLKTSELNVLTDPEAMPVTVYNYKFPGWAQTRGTAEFTMPECPELPSGLIEYSPDCGWNKDKQGNAQITSAQTSQLVTMGQSIYVADKRWTITSTYAQDAAGKVTRIYVLPGATLELPVGFEANSALEIYNYGTLNFSGDRAELRGNNKNSLLTVYLGSPIVDKELTLTIAGNCEFRTFVPLDIKELSFKETGAGYMGCAVTLEKLYLTNTSTYSFGYVKADEIEMTSDSKIVLRDGGYIETEFLDITNVQSASISAAEGHLALLQAKRIKVNSAGKDYLKGTFGNLNILCSNWSYGEDTDATHEGLGLNASVKLNEEVNVDKEETGDTCAPVLVLPKDDEPKGPDLETIGSVTNEHSHPISATCIQFAGNKAYASYHKRGGDIHGCIEVLEVSDKISLLVYAENKSQDYNHILLDNNRILTVGHTEKEGAIIGEIPLTADGTFVQGTELSYTTLKGNKITGQDAPEFYGGDGNCIIRNGNYIQVASYGGLHTLNSNLSRMQETSGAVSTIGSCKHLSISGNKIAELHLTSRDKGESSPAELRLFDAADYTWSNPTIVATGLEIAPIDGKNTIALDSDGSIYVCLGQNGIRKYSGNSEVGSYRAEGKAGANGLAVDSKYLYVAYGVAGLKIFDKNDLTKPVKEYTHTGGKSCNYVAVSGNLIYLAYGETGVDVIRLTER